MADYHVMAPPWLTVLAEAGWRALNLLEATLCFGLIYLYKQNGKGKH